MKKIVSLMIAMIILLSCCQITRVEKRRYFPGYYISTSEQVKKAQGVETKTHIHKKSVETIAEDINREYLQQESAIPDVTEPPPEYAANDAENVYAIPPKVPKISSHKERNTGVSTGKASKPEPAGKRGDTSKERVKKSRNHLADIFFLLISGILGVPVASFVFKRLKEPGKVAWWALQNKYKARGIIAALHFMILGLAVLLGWNLSEMGVHTTDVSTYFLLGLTALTVIFYPKRKDNQGIFKTSYRKQGLFALLLTIVGFLLLGNVSNKAFDQYDNRTDAVLSLVHLDDKLTIENTDTQLINQTPPLEKEPDPLAGQIILTFLVILLFAAGVFGIVLLTCALICNGQEVLAAITAIGLGALAIYLLIILLRAVWKQKPVKVVGG